MPKLAIWGLLLIQLGVNAEITARASCPDHYLANRCQSEILPLSIDGGKHEFHVQCEFPDPKSGGIVETIVHNALEVEHKIPNEFRSIGYQVHDLDLLTSMIRGSDECKQQMQITWPPTGINNSVELTVETADKKKYTIIPNNTAAHVETYQLELLNMTGIVYLRPKFQRFSALVTLGSLHCFKQVPIMENCKVEKKTLLPFIYENRYFDFKKQNQTLRLASSEAIQTAWNVSVPPNSRIVRWRVQFRMPELSYRYKQIIQIGDFVIKAGGSGKNLLITLESNSDVYEKFRVDITDDRLHLIYLKEILNSSNDKVVDYALYVDNQPVRIIRYHRHEIWTIKIDAAKQTESFGGCVSGIFFGVLPELDQEKMSLTFSNALWNIPQEILMNERTRAILHGGLECGIYSEDSWTSKSSSFGRVSAEDEYSKLPRSLFDFIFGSGSVL